MTGIATETFRPRGVVTDRPAVDVPAEFWTNSSNMVERDGVPERMPGLESEYEPLAAQPIYCLPWRIRTARGASWIYASRTGIFSTDGTGHFDITPSSPAFVAEPNGWSGDLLNRVPVLTVTSGDGSPPFYVPDTDTEALPLPGWFANGRITGALRAFDVFLLALGFADDTGAIPDLVRWSDAAAPGQIPQEWTPAVGNFAGERALSDTPGELVDGRTLGRNFLAYKDHSTYLGQITDDQFVMVWRLRFSQIGALSRNCVADIGNRHAVLADGDAIVTDGQNVRTLLKPQYRRFLFANISSEPDAFKRSFVSWDQEAQQVWIFWPRGADTECRDAIVVDMDSGTNAHIELPFAASSARSGLIETPDGPAPTWQTWGATPWNALNQNWRIANRTPASDRLLIAVESETGLYSAAGEGPIRNPDGSETPIATMLERATLDFGHHDRVKHVHRVWPRAVGTASGDTITVRVGVQESADAPISWRGLGTYDPVNDREGVPVDLQGRYISFRFESNAINRNWRLPSFAVDYSLRGRY